MKTSKPIIFIFISILVLMLSGFYGLEGAEAFESQNAPGQPVYSQHVFDCNTGLLAQAQLLDQGLIQPAAGCDSWQLNRYERPFNANLQGMYYNYVDIVTADMGKSYNWFYLRIKPFELSPEQTARGIFGLEMDLGREGSGDVLILADASQLSQEWSVQGVKVYVDANNDVGDQTPRQPDGQSESDGYELMQFDAGIGEDADLAWARLTEHDAQMVVEIAFKQDALSEYGPFDWLVWASRKAADPGGFDHHDFISQPLAGEVYEGMSFFPAKVIHAVDNTCIATWGTVPQAGEGSLCSADLVVYDNLTPPTPIPPTERPPTDEPRDDPGGTPPPPPPPPPCVPPPGTVCP